MGQVTSGTAFVMSHGMEHWHPNPDFFFLPGAGPVLDIGPYYVTNLVQLLGPVKRVVALTSTPSTTRTISSDPRKGETIPVETPTTIHALLDFASGAVDHDGDELGRLGPRPQADGALRHGGDP